MGPGEPGLGSLLRRLRASLGMTQEELAERAGVSARSVSDIERGLRTSVYRDTAERLANALGLEDEERESFEAIARGRNAAGLGGAWRTGKESLLTGAVPSQPTRLIGRERELEVVVAAFADREIRLLTLTGAGGIGKTRIALDAAMRAQGLFRHGVFFVSLAATNDADLVASIVARALAVTPVQEPPHEAVVRHLQEKQTLLVLDTLEHLPDAAPLIGDLVAACAGLIVLVTSREPLHLRGEHVLAVAPLELPLEETGDLALFPATALFVERARALRPDLLIDQRAAADIVEICRRLSGLPLAIELAAARVQHLSLAALRGRLDASLEVLTRGPRDLPPRQRTMRETIAWSYELLNPTEQSLFRGLSIFAGGCTLEATAEVASPPSDRADVLSTLSALVDKSLVVLSDSSDGEPRYAMLDVIREYAAERRDALEESSRLAQRHAEYYVALAERGEPQFGRFDQDVWYRRLDSENENLRSALQWSLGEQHADLALRLAGSLWQFWRNEGRYAEGRTWLRKALACEGEAPAEVRAKALWGAAWLALHQGDLEDAKEWSEQLLLLSESEDDRITRRNALTVRAMVAMAQGRFIQALSPLRESVDICRALGPSWHLATSMLNLALASMQTGGLSEAQELLEEALLLYQRLGDKHFVARARAYLAHISLLREERQQARALMTESLELFEDLGDNGGIAEALDGLAAVSAAESQMERAARLVGAAEALRETILARPLPFEQSLLDRHLAAARSSGDGHAWESAKQEGRGMAFDRAIAYARGDDEKATN